MPRTAGGDNATVYVIPGSHACRSALLMLEHKDVPYRRVEIVTLLHPVAVRLRGFNSGGQTRRAGSTRPVPLRVGDLLGTVPALACDGERISTNYRIARFLDHKQPEPALVPADPEARARVEEAERWANEILQMFARRIVFAATLRDPAAFSRSAGDGRLGHLLYRHRVARRWVTPSIGRLTFATRADDGQQLVDELPGLLDRVGGWIEDGVLNGSELNVADFMIAPSLALILYNPDARPAFAGRSALDLVDRLLPEPG